MCEPLPFDRLTYTSHSNAPLDLHVVLEQWRRNNLSLRVTGGLAVVDGVILQYLEGAEGTVEVLFARIAADARHSDVKILERRAVSRRMLSDRSIAMLEWTDATKQIFRSFAPGIDLDLYKTDPTTAAPLFRARAPRTAGTG